MTNHENLSAKQHLIEKGISGLALDIDETLSWTVGWWFEEMQKVFGNPENLSVRAMIKKYRYARHVPLPDRAYGI